MSTYNFVMSLVFYLKMTFLIAIYLRISNNIQFMIQSICFLIHDLNFDFITNGINHCWSEFISGFWTKLLLKKILLQVHQEYQ